MQYGIHQGITFSIIDDDKSAVCRADLYHSKILLNVCSNDVNADLGRRNMAGKSALLEENAEIGRQKVARKTATNKGNTDLGRQKEPRWSASNM